MTDKTFSFEGLVQLDGAADAGACGPNGCTPATPAASAADDEDEPDRPAANIDAPEINTAHDKAAMSRR